jgi:asparagine synthase (glutamine-hydrolysing)
MCGIAGVLSLKPVAGDLLAAMGDAVRHRGPDDEGIWIGDGGRVGFSHRRLAIIDLSAAGHQPMQSSDGRYMLSYNGEIYNHAELRRELDRAFGPLFWRGQSDSETLVEGIARWGLEATLHRCIGMFALSLWDDRDRMLHLARDRFGEKPLCYGWVGGDFVFASELTAIRRHPGFGNEISREALGLYAARGYVPAPHSIYQSIFKLQPGCILSASPDIAASSRREALEPGQSATGHEIRRYWCYRQTLLEGLADPIGSESEATDQLEAVLGDVVAGQLVADVPVGAFLSGGVDSSTVVALACRRSTRRVNSYSIGFEDPAYDEAPSARAVAAHLGTDHHELYVTAADARAVIPQLPGMYGEPFADSSQIPTYLVSAFARQDVKVALSGDGGDELFGGYNRYIGLARAWDALGAMGPRWRSVAANGASIVPAGAWNRLAGLGGRPRPPFYGVKLQKGFRTIRGSASVDELTDQFLDEWDCRSPVTGYSGYKAGRQGITGPTALQMMFRDAIDYLPDDILCKVDRAAMAVSLESRVPFLDHRVAALAAKIPLDLKIRRGKGKHVLRRLLARYLPTEMFDRPKAGFAMPVGEWMKGSLRDWAEDLLDPRRMAEEGWLDPQIVQRRWQAHLSGQDATAALWSILMFQAWLREQKAAIALAA